MKSLLASLVALTVTLCIAGAREVTQQDYGALRAEAEAHYARSSFTLARRAYQRAAQLELGLEEQSWVDFRLVDTRWRSAAASEDPDPSELDAAREELEEFLRGWKRAEERTATWALAEASLGDFHWTRRNAQNWGQAWPHYQAALDHWAGSVDLEVARVHYLDIVESVVRTGEPGTWRRRNALRQLPESVLEGAARLARTADELGAAHYHLATRLRELRVDARTHERTQAAYLAAIAAGRGVPEYESALYDYGTWLEERGTLHSSAERGVWTEPDYVAALAQYRRLVEEFERGEGEHWSSATSRIKAILGDEVSLSVGRFFLPGSELEVHLRWRNVQEVRLSLYDMNLVRDVSLRDKQHRNNSWLDSVDPSALRVAKRWSYSTGDDGQHAWGSTQLEMDFDLPTGAYLMEAVGGGARSREVVLVSDAGLIVKTAGDDVLAWFTDVQTGAPIAEAEVRLFHRNDNDDPWADLRATTDADGIARFDVSDGNDRRHQYFVAAKGGERQAFSISWEPWTGSSAARWKLYAFTDRAAYRPGQEVSWKVTGRQRVDSRYATPAGVELEWELAAQTGAIQAKGSFSFNDFGSAWGTLSPEESWPLGLYSLRVYEKGSEPGKHGAYLAGESLFRLEEYKLPEFTVGVEFAENEDGTPRRFHPGSKLSATIAADYYFGGAVSEASVVVEVFRRPFWPSWSPPREFPWFYEDNSSGRHWWGGPGNRLHETTLKTDSEGKAEFSFETGQDDGQDYEYTIQARVTDSSRREISGSGIVRVTRQGWFAYLEAAHTLHRPGEPADLDLNLLDANQSPVRASGELALLRRVWRETWVSPEGRLVEGDVLRAEKASNPVFPPPAEFGKPAWKLERRGYEDELVTSIVVESDAQGRAKWTPVLTREGYYVVRFSGEDERGIPVQAETQVYAATASSRELGREASQFALVLDKDTFVEGEPGAILLTAPASGRSVLFTVETGELVEYRVVRMDGTVKLISVEVDERWVPNVFVSAAGFHAGEVQVDTQRIVVPPRKHFLDVAVELEPEVCLPGEEAAVTVTLTDHEGHPVVGEVGVSLVDESVAAIQEDLAIDPRRFFYGEVRQHRVQTRSSAYEKSYARLVRDAQGDLHDVRYAWALDENEEWEGEVVLADREDLAALGYGGGGGGPAERSRGRSGNLMRKEAGVSGPASPGAMASDSDDFFLGAGVRDQGVVADSIAPGGGGGGSGSELVVAVRKDFRETALWRPDLVTDSEGKARLEFTYPDSLTRWRAVARALSAKASFGEARGEGRTRLPLSVRLQAPRFFVVGDECIVSLNLDNRTDEDLDVFFQLAVEGLSVLGFVEDGALRSEAPETLRLPAQGGERLDWRVRVETSGAARFVAKVAAGDFGDGLERELPIFPHGVPVLEAKSGRIDGDGVDVVLDLPAARAVGSTEVFVQVTPSLAVTMLDALPYLVDYPYGCTEQTLSRFVPATVVRRTLENLGLDAERAMSRAFGGIEAEFADKTQRKTGASLAELERVTRLGLERLYGMQHGDGSWSWWKHGEGDAFMTAYTVWGLTLARDAGVDVDAAKLDAGGRWLGERLVEEQKRPELHAWMLHAHARWMSDRADDVQRSFSLRALETAMERRTQLNAYGKALVALAAVDLGRRDAASLLAENLIDGVLRDEAPDASIVPVGHLAGGTQSPRAHWGEDGVGYRWSDGGVEATAFALMALIAVDPTHELVEPAADWLVANRRGAQWSNTKTTAIVVLALERYLAGTRQLDRNVSFTVAVNGVEIARRELTAEDLVAAPARFAVPAEHLRDGANRVEVRRTGGEGPLYFSAQARFFSQEEPVRPRGHEIFVRRQYFRLVARPTLLQGFVYERVPLEDGDSLVSGERVEVVLTVEAKNHLEYLLFEDLKPAGLEATQLKSGESMQARELRRDEVQHRFGSAEETTSGVGMRVFRQRESVGYTGRSRRVHQELRDRKVAIFLDQCPEGLWELRYDLRAEVPGAFHALPLLAEAMYVPEVRANGAELRLTVTDRE